MFRYSCWAWSLVKLLNCREPSIVTGCVFTAKTLCRTLFILAVVFRNGLIVEGRPRDLTPKVICRLLFVLTTFVPLFGFISICGFLAGNRPSSGCEPPQ